MRSAISLGVVLLVGSLGLVWVYQRAYETLRYLASAGMSLTSFPALVLIGSASVMLLLSSNRVLDQLYLRSDLDLLSVAPLTLRSLFFLKVLESAPGAVLAGVPAYVMLTAYLRVAGKSGGLDYLSLLLGLLLLLSAVLALALILVMLITRLLAPRIAKNVTQTIIYLLTVLVPLALIRDEPLVLANSGGGDIWGRTGEAAVVLLALGVLGGVTVALFAGAYYLFCWTFYETGAGFREVPLRYRRSEANAPLLLGWPGRAVRSVIQKDLILLMRAPRPLIVLLIAPILFGLLLRPFLVGTLAQQFRPTAGLWLGIFLGLIPALYGSMLIGGSALSREGRNIALLRTVPLSAAQLMWAKFWGAYLPVIGVCVLTSLVSGVLLQLSALELIIVLLGIAWCAAGCIAAMLGSEALGARFREQAGLSLAGAAGLYVLCPVFVVTSLLGLIWVLLRLGPAANELIVIPRLVLGEAFINSGFLASGPFSILSLALISFVIVAVWKLGCRRLAHLQVS